MFDRPKPTVGCSANGRRRYGTTYSYFRPFYSREITLVLRGPQSGSACLGEEKYPLCVSLFNAEDLYEVSQGGCGLS